VNAQNDEAPAGTLLWNSPEIQQRESDEKYLDIYITEKIYNMKYIILKKMHNTAYST